MLSEWGCKCCNFAIKTDGRYPFDVKSVEQLRSIVDKLEEVWALDGSDTEAASYANISKSTLSKYLQRHPKVAENRDRLKQKPFLKARRAIVADLDSGEFALKYMERKKKSEFSTKSEVDQKLSGTVSLSNLIDNAK